MGETNVRWPKRDNGQILSETTKIQISSLQQKDPQRVTTVKHAHEDKQLQSCLSLFDLVFYVPLRYAKQGICSVEDLICDSLPVCNQRDKLKIRQILSDCSIPCLVILDGLDEWRAPDTCRFQGVPDSDGLVQCTLLYSMRPWKKIILQLRLDNLCDKVVRILGLRYSSVETVIENVLKFFFGLKVNSSLFNQKFKRCCEKARLREIQPLIRIPLMLIASCLMWNEEGDDHREVVSNQGAYFMTFFYCKLTEMTITRTEKKHAAAQSLLCEKRQNKSFHRVYC